MKKRLAALLGVLVLSSVSFGATSNIQSSLNNLEQKLAQLERLEQAKFEEQRALAEAAANKLETYSKMSSTIDERIAAIEANAEISIFNKEFKDKASEYRKLKEELEKEIAKEQAVIQNFELLKSLR